MIKVVSLIVLLIALCVFFYFLIYPIWAGTAMGRDEYRGKELFVEETYLEYDSSEEFKAAVSSLEFVYDNEIIDFVYFDHPRQDHLIWGKIPDFYVLDICVGQNFESILLQYWDENAVYSDYGSYVIKLHEIDEMDDHFNQLYLAFYEDVQLVRIIYRTEMKEPDNKPYIDNSVWYICDDWE